MCGPKTEKTILDHRPFGFPFDRKNDFDIYEEEWVKMSLSRFCQYYVNNYSQVFFNSSVAIKEIKILYKPDGTTDADLKAHIEPLTTTSTSSTTTTPTTTTELKEGESCEDSRDSKKMHTWKLFNWILPQPCV